MSARQHAPGTCRLRHAEGLCRVCAAAFLGGSITWFDRGPRKALPFVRCGGKLTWLLDDLRAWQRGHREAPGWPVAPPAASSKPEPEAHSGTSAQRASSAQEIARRLGAEARASTSKRRLATVPRVRAADVRKQIGCSRATAYRLLAEAVGRPAGTRGLLACSAIRWEAFLAERERYGSSGPPLGAIVGTPLPFPRWQQRAGQKKPRIRLTRPRHRVD